jgi:hypothetical protein
MSKTEEEYPEDQLAEALAAFDDRLAAGMETPGESTVQAIEPALLSDWNRLTAFLSLVEKAWPRADATMDRPTKPARARAETKRTCMIPGHWSPRHWAQEATSSS